MNEIKLNTILKISNHVNELVERSKKGMMLEQRMLMAGIWQLVVRCYRDRMMVPDAGDHNIEIIGDEICECFNTVEKQVKDIIEYLLMLRKQGDI